MGVLDDLGIAADHAQVTGHPEMDHEVLAPVEPAEDVLAPTLRPARSAVKRAASGNRRTPG